MTVTKAKTSSTTPPSTPTAKPTEKPTDKPISDKPRNDESTSSPSTSPSDTPSADQTTSATAAPAPQGALAHTGADATPWLLGGAGLLLATGAGADIAARRRCTDDGPTEN
ncbi:hypothetical protein [Streptomyces sp. NPDC039016]|uniref:hypothetical protein n=1 Tax=Streptomyces sp. NPDC039016 TaxID=3154330 RepID=UPI0033EF764D